MLGLYTRLTVPAGAACALLMGERSVNHSLFGGVLKQGWLLLAATLPISAGRFGLLSLRSSDVVDLPTMLGM